MRRYERWIAVNEMVVTKAANLSNKLSWDATEGLACEKTPSIESTAVCELLTPGSLNEEVDL